MPTLLRPGSSILELALEGVGTLMDCGLAGGRQLAGRKAPVVGAIDFDTGTVLKLSTDYSSSPEASI